MSRTPPVALLVTHTVADYATWKAAFDGHQSARSAAGVLGHHINRNGDEVTIYLPATDRSRLEAFVSSPDLKATMERAGVTSAPRFTWLRPVEDNHVGDRATASMMVTHRVANFAAWKRIYDSVEDLRREHGVIGAAVNQSLDDPNEVIVYHQAESREALEAFSSSTGLKAAMQAAGVTSAPEFRFADALPGAAY